MFCCVFFFFFKQKTAYEMRISDWSSDVCSSDLQLRFNEGAGAYASQSGEIVTRWASQWERPELWILDFHHHLFAGDDGEWVIGIAGLCGLFFVISGVILWWRTRKTFQFRLWPKRMSRPAIVMHHRDLGVVVAPLLLISIVTGTMMIFRPFAMADRKSTRLNSSH